MAVPDLREPGIPAVSIRLQAQLAADDPHGLAGAQQGTCDVIEARCSRPQRIGKDAAVAGSLLASRGIQGYIALALIALREVPIRFPMANEIEGDTGLQHVALLFSSHSSHVL